MQNRDRDLCLLKFKSTSIIRRSRIANLWQITSSTMYKVAIEVDGVDVNNLHHRIWFYRLAGSASAGDMFAWLLSKCMDGINGVL